MYDDDGDNKYHSLREDGTGIIYTKVGSTDPNLTYSSRLYVNMPITTFTSKSFIVLKNGWKIPKASFYCYDSINNDGYKEVYILFQDLYGYTEPFYLEFDTDDKVENYSALTEEADLCTRKYTINAVNKKDVDEYATHPLGFDYHLTVTSDDGTTYYINKRIRTGYDVVGVTDRYGNGYIISSGNSMDQYYTITDTNGIVYNCTDTGITRTVGETTTQLVSYENETVNSAGDTENKYKIDDEHIFRITKNSGTGNEISPDEENVTTYYMKQEYRYEYVMFNEKYLIYNLPYKIVMPG